jgi:hypothetical protein
VTNPSGGTALDDLNADLTMRLRATFVQRPKRARGGDVVLTEQIFLLHRFGYKGITIP